MPRNSSVKAIPVWLAAMPAWSLSLLTPIPFLVLLLRDSTLAARVTFAAYAVVWAGVVTLLITTPENDEGVRSNLAGFGLIALGAVGTAHAFVLRERRRTQVMPKAAVVAAMPETMETDVAIARRQWAAQAVRIDTLPPSVRPTAHATLSYLDKVITYVEKGGHADAELREAGRMLTDYLPTSIDTYLRLPSDYARTQHNPDGRTAVQELEFQLGLLEDASAEAARSIYREDAQRMEQQSLFLQDKFGRSELDLP